MFFIFFFFFFNIRKNLPLWTKDSTGRAINAYSLLHSSSTSSSRRRYCAGGKANVRGNGHQMTVRLQNIPRGVTFNPPRQHADIGARLPLHFLTYTLLVRSSKRKQQSGLRETNTIKYTFFRMRSCTFANQPNCIFT